MKIQLLKAIDATLGKAVATCLPAARKPVLAAQRRFLVIRPGGIGDAVLLIPALLALKARFPEAEITVLAERRNCAAFALCPVVDRTLLYDVPAELVRALCGSFDAVIDTEQWHYLSAVIARLTGAPVSIGFATNDRRRLFAHPVGYSHEAYEAQSFFHLLAPLGISCPEALQPPFLTVPEKATRRAEDLLAPFSGNPFVAIFTGASIAERRWGGVRFREVAKRLAKGGTAVAVVGGKGDRDEGERVVRGLGGLNLAGMTTLAETAAVIARSRLLLSGDSGVLHIAVGLGIPTVSLFGPGIEAKWGPRGEGHVAINRRLSCSPCTRFGTTPACPIRARCLSDISPDEVAAAVETAFNGKAPGA